MLPSSVTQSALNELGAARPGGANAAAATSELGQDQFLKLMLAQLRNQDPLKPLQPAEFLSQLAQFSNVVAAQQTQTSVADLAASMRSSQVMEGVSLVGRTVLAAGDRARLGETGAVRGAVDAPEGSDRIEVSVRDSSGALVRRLAVPSNGGVTDFAWDGLDDAGRRVAPGSYRFASQAGSGPATIATETLLEQRVQSVTLDTRGGNLVLNTGGGALALSAVRQVR